MGISIQEGSWPILPIFRFLEEKGDIPHREMYNIFNMGIGMVLAVSKADASKVLDILNHQGEQAYCIGKITDASGVNIQ